MTTETPLAAQTPRLNPFVFPSDTDFRFMLLIIAVLGVSLFYYQILALKIPSISQRWSSIQDLCLYEVYGQNFEDLHIEDLLKPEALSAPNPDLSNRYLECTRPVQEEKAAWTIGGMMLLLGTATFLYWIFPIWKIRRDHLTPLNVEDAPDVVAYLAGLCQEADLSQTPTFLCNPLNTSSSGLAFGRAGKYYVAFSGGLIIQFYTDLPAFRAVVLHELAHLKNADEDKTYFAVAVWRAFLVVGLLPLAIASLNAFFSELWSVAVLAALVYLIRNSILRARELYADARAAIWDGPQNSLYRVLGSLPNQQGGGWRSILQVHPTPSERCRMLTNPADLFQLNFWIAVATGIAVDIVRGTFDNWMQFSSSSLEWRSFISALFLAPLVVGIVGLGVWRAAFARAALGYGSIGTGRLAFGVTLGMLISGPLYFGSNALPTTDISGQSLPLISLISSVAFELFWSGLFFFILFVLFRWITAGAEVWLEVAAASRSPRPTYILCLIFAGVIFAAGFAWLLLPRMLFEIISFTDIEQVLAFAFLTIASMGVSLISPTAFVVLFGLWAFPLAAWFWRRRAVPTTTASWAFLDPSSTESLIRPEIIPLQPGAPMAMGLATGLLFCGILLVIRVLMKLSGLSDAVNANDQYKIVWFFGQVALAVLMQGGVAAVVSGQAKRLGWAHTLSWPHLWLDM